jgi:hypothetical protein
MQDFHLKFHLKTKQGRAHWDQLMPKGQPEQPGVVQPSETDSATERWQVQTRDAIEQPKQDEINRCTVVVVAANESHPIVAAEWLAPCNELF